MIRKLVLIFIFHLTILGIQASEEAVILEIDGLPSLKAPDSNALLNTPINQRGEICIEKDITDSISLDSDENVFESKAGQVFSNIINKKVIYNKYIDLPKKFEN